MLLEKKIFFLIDTYIYIYKSYYLANKDNYFNKSSFRKSFYIFFSIIKSRINLLKPKYIFFIFDSKNTNKKKIYKYYKYNRKNSSKGLIIYIKNIIIFIKKLGFKIFLKNGFEADELIARIIYFIEKKIKHNLCIYILSNDKDYLQLVNNNTYLLIDKNNIFGPKEVNSKFGVFPYLIVDYLALIGDKIDNIPGIKGIGIKTASLILNNIGGIKCIYKNLNNIKNLKIYNVNKIIKNLKKKSKYIKI